MAPHPASAAARSELVLGVIGGSGLYAIEGFENVETVAVDTPFGQPSSAYRVGTMARDGLDPIRVVFVPRHGAGHVLLPSEINYRANTHGLKQLGVTHLLSVSAVGSLREAIEPGHIVVPDQFIDRTKGRETTYFGAGAVAHVQFGHPTDAALRARVLAALNEDGSLEGKVHDGGTCVVMEGPAFSTRAESELYRSWGADLIGMTALPEAKLAREAEMAYALLAMSTDYDCWHDEEVTVEAVMAVMAANIAVAKSAIVSLARSLPATTAELPYPRALEHAVMTAPDKIPAVTRTRLDLIIGHYIDASKR